MDIIEILDDDGDDAVKHEKRNDANCNNNNENPVRKKSDDNNNLILSLEKSALSTPDQININFLSKNLASSSNSFQNRIENLGSDKKIEKSINSMKLQNDYDMLTKSSYCLSSLGLELTKPKLTLNSPPTKLIKESFFNECLNSDLKNKIAIRFEKKLKSQLNDNTESLNGKISHNESKQVCSDKTILDLPQIKTFERDELNNQNEDENDDIILIDICSSSDESDYLNDQLPKQNPIVEPEREVEKEKKSELKLSENNPKPKDSTPTSKPNEFIQEESNLQESQKTTSQTSQTLDDSITLGEYFNKTQSTKPGLPQTSSKENKQENIIEGLIIPTDNSLETKKDANNSNNYSPENDTTAGGKETNTDNENDMKSNDSFYDYNSQDDTSDSDDSDCTQRLNLKWCICSRGEKADSDSKMCYECNQWYHLSCLYSDKQQINKIIKLNEDFICLVCKGDQQFISKYSTQIKERKQKYSISTESNLYSNINKVSFNTASTSDSNHELPISSKVTDSNNQKSFKSNQAGKISSQNSKNTEEKVKRPSDSIKKSLKNDEREIQKEKKKNLPKLNESQNKPSRNLEEKTIKPSILIKASSDSQVKQNFTKQFGTKKHLIPDIYSKTLFSSADNPKTSNSHEQKPTKSNKISESNSFLFSSVDQTNCYSCKKKLPYDLEPSKELLNQNPNEINTIKKNWRFSLFCSQNCIKQLVENEIKKLENSSICTLKSEASMNQTQRNSSFILCVDTITEQKFKCFHKENFKLVSNYQETLCKFLFLNPNFIIIESRYLYQFEKNNSNLMSKQVLVNNVNSNNSTTTTITPSRVKSKKTDTLNTKSQVKLTTPKTNQPTKTSPLSPNINPSPIIKSPDPECLRSKAKQTLFDALKQRISLSNEIEFSLDKLKPLVDEIEKELIKSFPNPDKNKKYLNKVRSLKSNISQESNKTFYLKILNGTIKPIELPNISNEQMASEEQVEEIKRARKIEYDAIKSHSDDIAKAIAKRKRLKLNSDEKIEEETKKKSESNNAQETETNLPVTSTINENDLNVKNLFEAEKISFNNEAKDLNAADSIKNKETNLLTKETPEVIPTNNLPTIMETTLLKTPELSFAIPCSIIGDILDTTDQHLNHHRNLTIDVNCKICTGKVISNCLSTKDQLDELVQSANFLAQVQSTNLTKNNSNLNVMLKDSGSLSREGPLNSELSLANNKKTDSHMLTLSNAKHLDPLMIAENKSNQKLIIEKIPEAYDSSKSLNSSDELDIDTLVDSYYKKNPENKIQTISSNTSNLMNKKPVNENDKVSNKLWEGHLITHDSNKVFVNATLLSNSNDLTNKSISSLESKIRKISFPKCLNFSDFFSFKKNFWHYLEHLKQKTNLVFLRFDSKNTENGSEMYDPSNKNYIKMRDTTLYTIFFNYLNASKRMIRLKIPNEYAGLVGNFFLLALKSKDSNQEDLELKNRFSISVVRNRPILIGVLTDLESNPNLTISPNSLSNKELPVPKKTADTQNNNQTSSNSSKNNVTGTSVKISSNLDPRKQNSNTNIQTNSNPNSSEQLNKQNSSAKIDPSFNVIQKQNRDPRLQKKNPDTNCLPMPIQLDNSSKPNDNKEEKKDNRNETETKSIETDKNTLSSNENSSLITGSDEIKSNESNNKHEDSGPLAKTTNSYKIKTVNEIISELKELKENHKKSVQIDSVCETFPKSNPTANNIEEINLDSDKSSDSHDNIAQEITIESKTVLDKKVNLQIEDPDLILEESPNETNKDLEKMETDSNESLDSKDFFELTSSLLESLKSKSKEDDMEYFENASITISKVFEANQISGLQKILLKVKYGKLFPEIFEESKIILKSPKEVDHEKKKSEADCSNLATKSTISNEKYKMQENRKNDSSKADSMPNKDSATNNETKNGIEEILINEEKESNFLRPFLEPYEDIEVIHMKNDKIKSVNHSDSTSDLTITYAFPGFKLNASPIQNQISQNKSKKNKRSINLLRDNLYYHNNNYAKEDISRDRPSGQVSEKSSKNLNDQKKTLKRNRSISRNRSRSRSLSRRRRLSRSRRNRSRNRNRSRSRSRSRSFRRRRSRSIDRSPRYRYSRSKSRSRSRNRKFRKSAVIKNSRSRSRSRFECKSKSKSKSRSKSKSISRSKTRTRSRSITQVKSICKSIKNNRSRSGHRDNKSNDAFKSRSRSRTPAISNVNDCKRKTNISNERKSRRQSKSSSPSRTRNNKSRIKSKTKSSSSSVSSRNNSKVRSRSKSKSVSQTRNSNKNRSNSIITIISSSSTESGECSTSGDEDNLNEPNK